ncbi:pseudouridine-5'-phosphate glycosidase [Peptoniphilus grossensis]|uniref:pseudouridine-5'-phosphate glycosidase n=2 Tax=Peptoniphilus TaxID=162289 RepID=UPI000301A5C3|nr:pseudouridine-5'-phosphate glycosidase [Peptoniphilus grossensis]MDU5100398.1 pseudouridine-5'-phosphate glycosidase [Peptoniphilus grossensis]MDU7151323.1 pseudouridine-5'-phosphate glycosidase [Peptoniphilus grossensis]
MISNEMLKKYVEYSDEVKKAMEEGKPVVALESTIISHGMPYPQNIETAKACEEIIRENGAVPATTAIIGGKIKIGLSDEELEFMATSKDIIKASRRDFAYIVSQGLNGATTVASTIIASRLAGIKIFVTGGLGGVHRHAEVTFDISRDLEELAANDIMIVCAGCKSILDIGLTLEYLETKGVPVFGYQTDYMPAFFTRKSEFKVDYNIKNPKEAAEAAKAQWELGLQGGILLTNPIPESDSMDEEKINTAIEKALVEAEEKGIHGKETTPFLLSKVLEVTEGKSLEANIALVKNNARLGAEVAKYLY